MLVLSRIRAKVRQRCTHEEMHTRRKLRKKMLHSVDIHTQDMTTDIPGHGYSLTHTLAVSQDISAYLPDTDCLNPGWDHVLDIHIRDMAPTLHSISISIRCAS